MAASVNVNVDFNVLLIYGFPPFRAGGVIKKIWRRSILAGALIFYLIRGIISLLSGGFNINIILAFIIQGEMIQYPWDAGDCFAAFFRAIFTGRRGAPANGGL
jgi:hypothetical protein